MKSVIQKIIAMALGGKLILVLAAAAISPSAFAAPSLFTATECVLQDTQKDEKQYYKHTLQQAVTWYNYNEASLRLCQKSIKIQATLTNLTKPIEIKVTPNSGSFTFGGADPLKPITLNAEDITYPAAKPGKDGKTPQNCAITITGSNIELQNIILIKSAGHGICVGAEGATAQPFNIAFSNVVVNNSVLGDGFRVADGVKNITFGAETKATYNNNGYGINFLGDMNGATSSYVYYSPTDLNGSVSLFQNKKAFKTGEQKVLKFANVYVNPSQIMGEVQVCDTYGSSCVPAPIVGVLVHRTRSKKSDKDGKEIIEPMFASFIGVARGGNGSDGPSNAISGNFMLKFDATLSTSLNDQIEMIPIWSESTDSNSGRFTVLGSSSKNVEVKFNVDLSADLNEGTPAGTTTTTQNPPAAGFSCIGGVIEKYKSFLTMVQLPNGSCYPVLADRLSGFQDKTACNAFVSAMQTNPTDSGVLKSVDSDFDGIPDAKEDRNHNCNTDAGESDWTKPDSDGDGVMDREESDTKGYMSCFKNMDTICSKINGAITCTDTDIEITSVEEQRNPAEGKTGKLHLVKPFTVDHDTYGAACTKGYPGEITAPCSTTANYISIDQDPARRGRPNEFSVANGDFCTQTDPSNPDTDFDGLTDGREQRGMVFNMFEKSYLFTIATDVFKKEKSDLKGEECILSATSSDPNTGSGREVVQRSYDAIKADGTTVPITIDLICMSDSVDHKHFSTLGLSDQTDPRNPDTDGDKWCDGTAGNKPNSGCAGMMGTDLCPLTADTKNTCYGDSSANNVYNYIDPVKKTELIAAIKNFKGLSVAGGDARQELLNQLKAIDPKGDPTHDTDQDGIPDLVENPDGLSITPNDPQTASGTIYTDPFRADSDDDGINDAHDPCPRDFSNTCVITSATAACTKSVTTDYSSQKALYAFMDWDSDNLYNSEENPNVNLSLDAGETCPAMADTDKDGLDDFQEVRIWKTNPRVEDTDGDKIKDGAEVTVDGIVQTQIVFSNSPGCFISKWNYVSEIDRPATDPTKADSDGDGIDDYTEIKVAKTNPVNPDSDGDGLCDGGNDVKDTADNTICIKGESQNNDGIFPYLSLDLAKTDNSSPAAVQFLAIGAQTTTLPNGRVISSSNPCSSDTDKDGKNDWAKNDWEGKSDSIDTCSTNPNSSCTAPNAQGSDSDLDGIPDSVEVNQLGTNPNAVDTDGDGLEDGCVNFGTAKMRGELCSHFTSATNANFASLGKGPGKAFNSGDGDTDPLNADTDFDGMKDGDELKYPNNQFKNPYQTDASGKLTYIGLYQKGINLNPNFYDTDGDGILDGVEAGAKFKAGAADKDFYCGLTGQQAVIAGGLTQYGDSTFTAQQTYAAAGPNPLDDKGTGYDTDGDLLPDGNTKTYVGRNAWGEDLNCDGKIGVDNSGNPTESDPRAADSNHDGVSDKDAICQNGICDPSVNLPYVYANQAGGGCSNTLMPGATLPATAGDFATLAMFLAPLGAAIRMRLRRK